VDIESKRDEDMMEKAEKLATESEKGPNDLQARRVYLTDKGSHACQQFEHEFPARYMGSSLV